jgi:hypothetical protein
MAIMHPEEIDSLESVTTGESAVFRFLREAAKPDKDYWSFFEPNIGIEGRFPDFILFNPKRGLLIIEVKDWALQQITRADHHQFFIQMKGQDEPRTNPDKQAKAYVNTLMERLRSIPGFKSIRPGFEGKVKVPIARMIAFPNINREEYTQSEVLPNLIPPGRIFFQDDIDLGGKMCSDQSGLTFTERITPAFPFKLEPLTHKEIERLKNTIYPELIQLPKRGGLGKDHFQKEVQALDEGQARLARNLGSGHQIIKGPPGCGKTLVLVHRCCQLRKYNPGIKRILLVCYNIALASYLKRLLQEKGIGLGKEGVEIYHFYELCADILGEKVEFDNKDSDYYQLVLQETLDALASKKNSFGLSDAVLVDEGQDFSDDMLRIILGLLSPKGNLIIALDGNQNLYRKNSSWKSLGIDAQGRSHNLEHAYRNTTEIFEFAQRFLGTPPTKKTNAGFLPLDCALHGDPPQLLQLQDQGGIENFLVTDIKKQIAAGEYRRSEIAIIYDDKSYGSETFSYGDREHPRRIRKKLEQAGVPVKWVSEDVRAKEMFDITTDRVSLISIHSAKGLDFDLVYLIGVDQIIPTDRTKTYFAGLIYVALTRAKHHLVIPFSKRTEFIGRMLAFKN